MRKFLAAFATAVFVAAGAFAKSSFYEAPVLMYHLIDEPVKSSSVYVRPDSFERQMEFLRLHRYHVVPLEKLLEDLKAGRKLPLKTVAITFDDGTIDNFTHAFPVLRKMKFPATIFMITSNIGRSGWLSEEDLKILDEAGITIGSHTANHAFLPELSPEEVHRELVDSKKRLETVLGHEVRLFSYPAGGVTPAIEQAVKDAGYTGAVTTNYGKTRHAPYAMHRIKVSDSSRNLFFFWAKVSGYARAGKKSVAYRTPSQGGTLEA